MEDKQLIETTDGDIEEIDGMVNVDTIAVSDDLPVNDEEAFAYKIIKRAAMLKGVSIDRGVFLRTELAKKCPKDVVDAAVATTPKDAGVSMAVLDELADAAISIETRKVAGLSALAGIPGGLAMFGTIPADLVQYFAHSLRIEQKLAYLYGWESFLNDEDEIDDETMLRLILFLGVMMNVGGVGTTLTNFAKSVAMASVAKTIEKRALTKTVWYGPLKKILGVIGVNVTKKSFAGVVSKGVPVVGGIVSGGITYATFRPGAASLKKYLRTLPQATGVFLSEEEEKAVLEQIEQESKIDFRQALSNAAVVAGDAANMVGEKAAVFAVVARDGAGVAANTAASGIKAGAGKLADRFSKLRASSKAKDDVSNAVEQLRALKGLLDDGIITQEDFDAKKKELLGL